MGPLLAPHYHSFAPALSFSKWRPCHGPDIFILNYITQQIVLDLRFRYLGRLRCLMSLRKHNNMTNTLLFNTINANMTAFRRVQFRNETTHSDKLEHCAYLSVLNTVRILTIGSVVLETPYRNVPPEVAFRWRARVTSGYKTAVQHIPFPVMLNLIPPSKLY